MPPVSGETAAFIVIVNDSDKPVRPVSASTPIAGMAMPIITTHYDHGGAMAMGMKDTPAVEVLPTAKPNSNPAAITSCSWS